jgi:hypothetical protein
MPETLRAVTALTDTQQQRNFPALWMRYSAERAVITGQERFEDGDVRDISHAMYLGYVDYFVADRRFANRLNSITMSFEPWHERVVRNGDVLNNGKWMRE